MPSNFGTPAPIDFSALSQIGQQFGSTIKNRRMSNALSSLGPDASLEDMSRAMLAIDPALGAKMMIEARQADALSGYRQDQLALAQDKAAATDNRSNDVQLLDWATKNKLIPNYGGGAEPFRLGPDGGTTPDVTQLPAVLADKLMTVEQKSYAGKAGANRAEAEYLNTKKDQASEGVERALTGLSTTINSMDDASVENALGPWQGDSETLFGYNPRSIAARNLGAVANAIPGLGGKESTYEVRAEVDSYTTAIANAIKPYAKGGGAEGQWTNYDQQKLEDIVGRLAESKDKAEFNRRLGRTVERLNETFGLKIDPKVVAGVFGGKFADRPAGDETVDPAAAAADAAEASEAGEVPVNKVKTSTVLPDGTVVPPTEANAGVPGASRDPRGAYSGPAPAGTVMSDGQRRIVKGADGRWYDMATKKPLPAPRP
jgi:hypothetical protein